jgi:predicted anti-sigma-YlaC factor YlaD
MKICEEIQEILIDEFYDKELDTYINKHIENCTECMEFKNKLYAASKKLDILKVENLSMPSDLFNIINAAEKIKMEKKKKFEIFSFVFASFSILIPFVSLGLYFEMRILLYIQIFLYLNMPLVLIPLIINRRMREVERCIK